MIRFKVPPSHSLQSSLLKKRIVGTQRRPATAVRREGKVPLLLAALFLACLAGAAWFAYLPPVVPAAYAIFSISAFAVYAIDKSAARHGRWRTPEKTLHMLALIGGWPGALLAQKILRHKSQKSSFQAFFLLTVLANCTMLGWFLYTMYSRSMPPLFLSTS